MLPYTDDMSFFERWFNMIHSTIDWILRRWIHIPWQTEIAKKHFGHLGELPSIDDVMKNVSLIFINTHRSILPVRPTMPGIIFIGGAHVEQTKPLPIDLKKFLDDAENGAIYFSFGTYVRSNEMPIERMKMFLGE